MNILKLRLQIIVSAIFLVLGLTFLATVPALADCTSSSSGNSASQIQGGIDCASGNNSGETDTTKPINNTIATVLNLLSVGIGVIAVVMLMVGGYRYIVSGGVAEKVATAKKTILYAIIGLVIVGLSQLIAQFVLQKATQTTVTGMSQEATRLT